MRTIALSNAFAEVSRFGAANSTAIAPEQRARAAPPQRRPSDWRRRMKGLRLLRELSRRRVLQGMLEGGAVVVALPLLDCFLNDNGTALASGEPMPLRFGTWFWGLGMAEKVFVPKTVGRNYDLPPEIVALAPVRDQVNLYTNFNAYRDTSPNLCHYTGWVVLRTGIAPVNGGDLPGETIDVTIARKIGRTTRFQMLTATATGDVRNSFSYENANSAEAAEWSPVAFYTKLFGPGYQDPNAATFKPDPSVMVRKSVLTGVLDQTRRLERTVGADDRARLDQYFSDLRDLERQFNQQLSKPKPIASCHGVDAPKDDPPQGEDTRLVALRHQLMTDLMVMAVACDQTRVVNMAYSAGFAATIKAGYDRPHHTCTHEEGIDPQLGYQPTASWFTRRAMERWSSFVQAFAKVKEGDGTLLDNCLLYATTDTALARLHTLEGIPMFTAGRAGGRVKAGLHIDGGSTAGTRLGFTIMKVFGVDETEWGSQSNRTTQVVSEMVL